MEIRELSADAEIVAAFPLMRELRGRIRPETFLAEVRRQQTEGYRLYGGYDDGRLVSLAGLRHTHTLARGECLFVDDFITAAADRGRGYGARMMRWLAEKAVADGVDRLYLDARASARGFYEKLGFHFHTSVPCFIDARALRREPSVPRASG